MKLSPVTLRELCVDTKLVSADQFAEALEVSRKTKKPLQEVLVDKGFVSEEHLGRLIAEHLGVHFVKLSEEDISEPVLKIIPELVAKTQKIVAFSRNKQGYHVAMNNPKNLEMIKWLEKKTGSKIIVYYATATDIEQALEFYSKGIREQFEKTIRSQLEKAAKEAKPEGIPIVNIVDSIVEHAFHNRASDIHIEPHEERVIVRFRIDGILHDIVVMPIKIHDLIVTRIKVISNLRTDEHRAAQDGKFSKKLKNDKFDIRVSILPITGGEKVVMRLLSETSQRLTLDELGFSERDFKIVTEAMHKPYGMILSTGPTGSGKTTSLYSIIKPLNTPEVNISTIEDPVEYSMERINQIQVNEKTGLTFSRGLRAIVRQDPDIIMVGEIRDQETADIAINSAMTGHLVFSTFHANTATTAILRLIEMGVKPFLVASAVNIIIGQRLVRRICSRCISSYEVDTSKLLNHFAEDIIKKIVKKKSKINLYHGKGCRVCGGTGYRGRTGIFEVLEISEEVKQAILDKKPASYLQKIGMQQGMTPMIEDGIKKMIQGITTLEELMRVMRE